MDSIIEMQDLSKTNEENLLKYKQVIAEMFGVAATQSESLHLYRGNMIERAVSLDLNTDVARSTRTRANIKQDGPIDKVFSNQQDSLYLFKSLESQAFPKLSQVVPMPLASPPDQITSSNLKAFIKIFSSRVMLIYDGLLTDKRIILAGSRTLSLSKIQDFIYAAAALVSPPLYGIHNKVLPYVPLSSIGMLENEGGFIAGVMNPMFLENRRCHDIAISVDQGTYKTDQSYQK